ncbi:hypothetical protein SDC9_66218 [bioreactor metagenome]|uniref:Uncharacterized protein n=1 Tax=bioreactor metagenome TaxID=1076179 RepID=A0A644XUB0_9ZZZZ
MHGPDEQRHGEDDQDADTRDRAVRGTDQAGHVATDRGHREADQQHVDDADDDQAARVGGQRGVADEQPQHQADRDHRGQGDAGHHGDRQVALGARQALAAAARLHHPDRLGDAAEDRAGDLQQRPDRGDRDGAGADEPDVVGERVLDGRGEATGRGQRPGGEHRQQDAVRDQHADDHRDADGEADQVADTDQGERQAGADHRAAGTDPEGGRQVVGHRLERGEQGEGGGAETADGDHPQAPLVLLGALAGVADAQHLGARDALRVREVGAGDQRAAQRDRVHHAEDAAQRTQGRRRPVREAAPPADDDQPGQDEDDGRQRARGGGDRLDDVVLADRVVTEVAQDRHRDDGRRDRRGERQAHLEAEVDVRGGEHQRDETADDDPSHGQFPYGCLRRGCCCGQGHTCTFVDDETIGPDVIGAQLAV